MAGYKEFEREAWGFKARIDGVALVLAYSLTWSLVTSMTVLMSKGGYPKLQQARAMSRQAILQGLWNYSR